MEFLNYLLVSIAVFSGLLGGWIVGRIAKEELKNGKKYFVLLQRILFSAILLLVILFSIKNIWLSLFFISAMIYFFAGKNTFKDITVYLLFSIIFYLSQNRLFLLQASLMFTYGFPAGSLIYMKKKTVKDIVVRHIWFIFLALALFLVV